MYKIAIEMHMPEGKRPGYYSQVVKALAGIPLFDRDKETLIVSDEPAREAIVELMQHYKFDYEEIDLILLPEQATLHSTFEDYGFESRSGHRYLYQHLTNLFSIESSADQPGDLAQALLQMEEHLIASYQTPITVCYAVDQTFKPLIQGIAQAYRCSLSWVEPLV
ncbi:MAG: hypothetical protein K0R67_3322 [Paenibacillus sp.]|nr:hypothetical protein [Paenibacillus sp.]